MFKRKKKEAGAKPDEKTIEQWMEENRPVKTAQEIEAEKLIARGERLTKLSREAAMWRVFASECKAGRWVSEAPSMYRIEASLSTCMDDDSAVMWRDFAVRMAEERERRLKEALSA